MAGSVEACLASMWMLIRKENPVSCADLQAKDNSKEENSCSAESAKPSRAAVPRAEQAGAGLEAACTAGPGWDVL